MVGRGGADYFIGEVLDRQPPGVRSVLLRTVLLDRMTGSLVDALTRRLAHRRARAEGLAGHHPEGDTRVELEQGEVSGGVVHAVGPRTRCAVGYERRAGPGEQVDVDERVEVERPTDAPRVRVALTDEGWRAALGFPRPLPKRVTRSFCT